MAISTAASVDAESLAGTADPRVHRYRWQRRCILRLGALRSRLLPEARAHVPRPGWWDVEPVATNSLYLAIDTNTNGACGLTRNDRSVECWGYRDTTYQRRHGPIANRTLGVSAFSVSIGGLVMVDAMGVRATHQGSLPLSRQSCDRAPADYNAWGTTRRGKP